ncbi:MAG: nuclear transport factor 2 family protein [Chloroflexota bacterium]
MADARTNEEIVRAYARASAELDLDTLAGLRHPEWSVLWPQSGEQVVSSESYAEIVRRYPGGAPATEVERIVGGEDRWVLTGANTLVRVAGAGDAWWGEWRMTYPDGQVYACVDLIELRDGRIFRETVYWAPPFDAPDWRRPFVSLRDGQAASSA